MQLIGLLDSPYVRRVAVSLQLLGVPFEHRAVSVFRGFDTFRTINPVVKAPTLVCDDGTVLMDSTLILQHAEFVAPSGRTLMPRTGPEHTQALRVLGLALAALEKSVSIIYEHEIRPADRRHAPWIERVTGQMHAAFEALEAEMARVPRSLAPGQVDQASVTTAVTWHFVRAMLPDLLDPARHRVLQAFSEAAERLPEFLRAPHGEATCVPA